ncbi:MAG: hypothetical protein R3342_01810 [Lutibacter sp.]|uniref:hypothetical protein n=1 Tax=Lutibacter sp. TaxID=1925666 RepID=UPI00299ECBA7|nr:hypothetical protein [Lutibacter sp.]MDX1828258.1 hypothetical protein [Lutibacter sp.]
MKAKNKHSNFKLTESQIKTSGFKVPMDYFDEIENDVISKLNTEKFSKKNNFKVPNDYFNSIEDIVVTKLKAEAIQKNDTAIIPDNYFDEIEDKVFIKLKSERKSKVITLKNFTKFIAPIAIAASLLLFIYLNTTSKKYTFDSLPTAAIESYFESGGNDVDILSIASLYTEDELKNDEIFDSTVTDSVVVNYLSEENLDEIIYEN